MLKITAKKQSSNSTEAFANMGRYFGTEFVNQNVFPAVIANTEFLFFAVCGNLSSRFFDMTARGVSHSVSSSHYSNQRQQVEKSDTEQEALNWHNKDNNAFYETVKVEGLKELAEKGGLASCCDVKALEPYWSQAQSILEVGAGYGRVIDYLLKHQFKGTITAVERCDVFCKYLEEQFGAHQQVQLLQGDILSLGDIGRYDLILVLWTTVADFSPIEQSLLFMELANLLHENGQLIVDSIPDDVAPLESKKCASQFYIMQVSNALVHGYMVSANEVKQYGENAGFSNSHQILYNTDIQRKKWLHILG